MSAEVFFAHLMNAVERLHKAVEHVSLVVPAAAGLKPVLTATENHLAQARKAFDVLVGEGDPAVGTREGANAALAGEPVHSDNGAMPVAAPAEADPADDMDAGVPTAPEAAEDHAADVQG